MTNKKNKIDRNKAVFFVSLNSNRLEEFIQDCPVHPFSANVESVDIFVFDNFEVLNGLFFNANDVGTQFLLIEETIARVETNIYKHYPISKNMIRSSKSFKEIEKYLCVVYQEYICNNSFKRHCKSQTFRNLHPKLRKMDIINNKSPLIEILSPFLLTEIAWYLYIYDTGKYILTYGLEEEMEIITAIKAGKYPAFNHFVQHPVEHHKIFLYKEKTA